VLARPSSRAAARPAGEPARPHRTGPRRPVRHYRARSAPARGGSGRCRPHRGGRAGHRWAEGGRGPRVVPGRVVEAT